MEEVWKIGVYEWVSVVKSIIFESLVRSAQKMAIHAKIMVVFV